MTSLPERSGGVEQFDKLPKTVTHAELMRMDFPPPKWGIDGLCPQGVVLMASKPKIGKSWLALQMCQARASGGKLWKGRDPEMQGEALYLALEDNQRRLHKRSRRSFPKELNDGPGAVFQAPQLDTLHFATEWPRMGDVLQMAQDEWQLTRQRSLREAVRRSDLV